MFLFIIYLVFISLTTPEQALGIILRLSNLQYVMRLYPITYLSCHLLITLRIIFPHHQLSLTTPKLLYLQFRCFTLRTGIKELQSVLE